MKILKILSLLLILTLGSCSIEGPECSNATYSLVAFEADNGMLHVSYRSEIPGFELSTGCATPDGHLPDTYTVLEKSETKNWAEWATTRVCSPQYMRVRSLDGKIEKIVRL